jgi:hypothetical protein
MQFIKSTLLCLPLLAACSQSPQTPEETATTQPVPVVGGDSDAHGCKGSAGYTWSEVKQNCIRIFEDGIALAPQDAVADKTTAAFVVFRTGAEDAVAEVFIPGQTSGILMEKAADGSAWQADTLQLTYAEGKYLLAGKSGVSLYAGAKQ